MDEREGFNLLSPLEGGQPVAGGVGQFAHRPLDRGSRIIVEGVSFELANRGRVVIPAHAKRFLACQQRNDLIGLRSVTDNVTQLPYGVIGTEAGEDRLERRQVAVDVGQHGDPHWPSA
jgi:hypothetical protein